MTEKYTIPFNKPFIIGKELQYIRQAVENGHLSGNGPFTKACQQWLESTLRCQKAFLTHSCTGALEMAALLLAVEPGDEVIMPSFTFVSTANAFVLRGAVPVFIDIQPDNLCINDGRIEAAISPKTKGIVPVHYAGISCNMDPIMQIATQYNLWVVEDAAQALLSSYKKKFLGTIGHLGCLSFHETKNIISGEGGALLVNDAALIERCEFIWEKGTDRRKFFSGEIDKYTWVDIGSSFPPSEIVSAFLFAQLENAERIIQKRRRLYELYNDYLKSLEENGYIRLPFCEEYTNLNGHMFYLITRSNKERNDLIQYLRAHKVLSVFHYIPLHLSRAGKKYGIICGKMSVTEEISEWIVRLPLFYEMQDSDVESVAELVKDFYEKR
ncbi:dTDP-4-amino-4,6-dideoxygalactose transaminase [Thermodesulfobacteriota bacterium]